MAEATKISWAHDSFNPWVGCMKVSPGCANCYAEARSVRFKEDLWGPAKTTPRRRTAEANWRKPIQWNKEAAKSGEVRRVFCASLADVFEDHPMVKPWRADLFRLIKDTPALTWLLLTKRPENVAKMVPNDWGRGYPNVWLGTSVESMEVIVRLDHLKHAHARVKFVSYEPALGPLAGVDLRGIDWLIYGGESGKDFRPDREEWARDISLSCILSGTAFFYKQEASRYPGQRIDAPWATMDFPASQNQETTTNG